MTSLALNEPLVFCGRIILVQVILPELWDTAVDLFDASRAGVVSDRKRTQKVQEKVGSLLFYRTLVAVQGVSGPTGKAVVSIDSAG